MLQICKHQGLTITKVLIIRKQHFMSISLYSTHCWIIGDDTLCFLFLKQWCIQMGNILVNNLLNNHQNFVSYITNIIFWKTTVCWFKMNSKVEWWKYQEKETKLGAGRPRWSFWEWCTRVESSVQVWKMIRTIHWSTAWVNTWNMGWEANILNKWNQTWQTSWNL